MLIALLLNNMEHLIKLWLKQSLSVKLHDFRYSTYSVTGQWPLSASFYILGNIKIWKEDCWVGEWQGGL